MFNSALRVCTVFGLSIIIGMSQEFRSTLSGRISDPSGASIPGIRPGEQTARYIERIMLRLTLAGAIYVTLVCLLPEFLILKWNVPFYFGGTSLLIIVVVTMDFMAQVQAYIMSHQYESLLKKTNFKGGGGLPAR